MKKETKQKIQVAKDIVLTIAILGVGLTAAIAAPNAIGAFGSLFMKDNRLKSKYSRKQVHQGINYLQRKKIIGIGKDQSGNTIVKLTELGQEKLLKYRLEDMVLKREKKWDGKWRIVMFDIPEKFKHNRNTLSFKLKVLGFYPMQKSAFIWPYPVEKEVTFLKEIYEVSPFVSLVIAEKIENEHRYLRYFSLSRF